MSSFILSQLAFIWIRFAINAVLLWNRYLRWHGLSRQYEAASPHSVLSKHRWKLKESWVFNERTSSRIRCIWLGTSMNIKKTLDIYQAQWWHIPFPWGSGRWDVHMIWQMTGLSTGPVLAYILSSAHAADPCCCRAVLPFPFDFCRSKKGVPIEISSPRCRPNTWCKPRLLWGCCASPICLLSFQRKGASIDFSRQDVDQISISYFQVWHGHHFLPINLYMSGWDLHVPPNTTIRHFNT